MSETMHTIARQLCAHITVLKQVHRAGLTPSFGQVEDLFDYSEQLQRTIEAVDRAEPRRRCARPTCGDAAVTTVGALEYCGVCADAVRRLLKNLDAFGIQAVRANWPSATDGGVVTGPDPRD